MHYSSASGRPERYGLIFWLFAILGLLNFALPKAGIKLGGLPVTWGYLLLCACGLLAAAALPFRRGPRLMPTAQFLFGFLPLGLLAIIKAGTPEGTTTGALVWSVNFIVLPSIILIFFSRRLEDLSDEQIARVVSVCFRLAVAWGIFNFFLYAATKRTIEIAYVTVNADDYGMIFDKNNRRGGLMKLVSTYNNGNIFGVCALILGPLYLSLDRSRFWRTMYVAAIVLTLSRTAWFGLIAMFIILRMLGLIRLNRASVWALAIGGVISVASLLPFMGWQVDRLTDSTLGNRIDLIYDFTITIWGENRISIPELTYVGLAQSFGFLGLLFVMAALFMPAVYGLLLRNRLSALQKAALAGILTYLFVAIVDGALAFIPVLAFFLFTCAMLYRQPSMATGKSAAQNLSRPHARGTAAKF